MTTTTTTDTLTRWTALWQQDEGLRPANGGYLLAFWSRDACWIGGGEYKTEHPDVAAALIRDSAVRWLAEKAWEPCIMPDGSLTLEAAFGAEFGGPFAGPLDDALYAACKAVLAKEKT